MGGGFAFSRMKTNKLFELSCEKENSRTNCYSKLNILICLKVRPLQPVDQPVDKLLSAVLKADVRTHTQTRTHTYFLVLNYPSAFISVKKTLKNARRLDFSNLCLV